jgi:hypothetical protein
MWRGKETSFEITLLPSLETVFPEPEMGGRYIYIHFLS